MHCFCRGYEEDIVPALIAQHDLESVKVIAMETDKDHKDLLQENVPKIVTHILPVFATAKKTSAATTAYNLLSEELTQEVSWNGCCYGCCFNKLVVASRCFVNTAPESYNYV